MSETSGSVHDEKKYLVLRVLMWREKREVEVKVHKGARVIELLKKLGSAVDGTLVFDGDRPMPVDEEILNNMELKVISVASGG